MQLQRVRTSTGTIGVPNAASNCYLHKSRPFNICMHALSNTAKRECKGKTKYTPSSGVTVTAVHSSPAPGSSELKPPPDVEWKKQAIATMQKYTSIPIVDERTLPDSNSYEVCQEISPHLLDRVVGDGHCGFRALSKSITRTESNHTALRATLVTFMRISCAGRRRPWLVPSQLYPTIGAYILDKKWTQQAGCQTLNCCLLPHFYKLAFLCLQLLLGEEHNESGSFTSLHLKHKSVWLELEIISCICTTSQQKITLTMLYSMHDWFYSL